MDYFFPVVLSLIIGAIIGAFLNHASNECWYEDNIRCRRANFIRHIFHTNWGHLLKEGVFLSCDEIKEKMLTAISAVGEDGFEDLHSIYGISEEHIGQIEAAGKERLCKEIFSYLDAIATNRPFDHSFPPGKWLWTKHGGFSYDFIELYSIKERAISLETYDEFVELLKDTCACIGKSPEDFLLSKERNKSLRKRLVKRLKKGKS